MHLDLILIAGLAVGVLYGLFGVGSAFGTPVLALLGVPGLAAVVGPLPALLPGSAAGAWTYSKRGEVDWSIARQSLLTAVPAAVVGSLASRWVGGVVLLVLSGLVLFAVGVRVLRPAAPSAARTERADGRRANPRFVLTAAAGVGFASGLLANGGGFLLVPLFLLVLGLDLRRSAGTSMVVAAGLTVPTLITHLLVGDVNWMVSLAFAAGMVPGTLGGGRIAAHVPSARLRTAFGILLVGFATWFLARQALAAWA